MDILGLQAVLLRGGGNGISLDSGVENMVRISDKIVRRMIERGDLTAYRVGERVQLRDKDRDLEQYFEG